MFDIMYKFNNLSRQTVDVQISWTGMSQQKYWNAVIY